MRSRKLIQWQRRLEKQCRVFFGDAGPNDTSSLHVVGEIFTRDYLVGLSDISSVDERPNC